MPKSERDEVLGALTSRIFSSMLEELIMDSTLQAHHEVARSKVVCPVCHTRCGSVHTPGSSAINNDGSQTLSSGNAASRAVTPSSAASNEFAAAKLTATGTSTPTKADGNLYLECGVCARQIASNRFAPHLASCMGLSSTRRGAVRGTAKPKLPSEADRSASPISENGNFSDDKGSGKGKAKSKADEGEYTLNGNGKRKRPASPQLSPNKKSKKGKTGSPVSRLKAYVDIPGLPGNPHYSPSTNSQSKIPSKLRDSSTASLLERSSTSSRESSLEAVPTPASSTFSTQSPAHKLAMGNGKVPPRGRPPAKGTGPPPKRPAQPIHLPHYDIDAGHETGSSTDTDGDS